jgi:cysteine desulfurase/selenocysteine lyase
MKTIRQHEIELTRYTLAALEEGLGDEITVFGPRQPESRGAVISFELKGVHPHDVSQLLDQEGVCVRAGHHCAKPLMRQLGVNATARASFYLYNGHEDADALVTALQKCQKFFR